MFTLDNTEGFDQETLDKMNVEVEFIMNDWIKDNDTDLDDPSYLQWSEEEVLKKYGGA